MKRLSVLFVLLLSCVCGAAEPIVLTGLTDGVYVLTVKGGAVTLEPAKVVTPSPGPVPTPTPDPTPDPIVPTPADTLTKVIVAEVNKVAASNKRHEVAMKLGKTYEMLAGQTIPPAKAVEAADKIVALALGQDASVLSGVCSAVDAELKKATSEAGVSAVFKEAGAALATTVPASGDDTEATVAKRYGFDWDNFLKFLMQLLQVLLPIILKI